MEKDELFDVEELVLETALEEKRMKKKQENE